MGFFNKKKEEDSESSIFYELVESKEEKDILKLCHRDLTIQGKVTKYTRKKIFDYFDKNKE